MYRFIPFKYYNPYFKTGLNKALIESIPEEDPVIFLSGWSQKCINLGYSQSFEEEVNTEEFEKKDDVILVRRQGGGGTTFLTPDGEITWGIVAPSDEFPEDVNEIYQEVCGKISRGLKELDIDAKHEPVNDIITSNGKISGATLKREEGVTYIGGTLLYDVDIDEMFSLLTPDKEKKKDKQISDYKERVSTIRSESEATFDEVVKALKNSLLKDVKWKESNLKFSEVQRAEELANKYSKEEWLYRK